MRAFVGTWLVLLLLCVAVPVYGVTVRIGTGRPEGEWYPLGWWGSKAMGHAGLIGEGFLLSAAQVPPVPAYELMLKFVPCDELLFILESPAPAGKVNIYLDGNLIKAVEVPVKRTWWLLLSDLPSTGLLRIELGAYCDLLLIRSVNCPSPKCPECPSCWPWFGIGLVIGALIMWFILR